MIRVMLVDDHAVVRMGFRMLLSTADIEVVAEADSGEQACRDYPQLRPDVVVMDISMPGIGGLALPADLAPGQWRWLTPRELALLVPSAPWLGA